MNTTDDRIDRLEEQIKEREVSLLRALKTLIEDLKKYREDGSRDFPQAALLGVIFAYLRPRIVVTIAGFGALVFAAAQVYLVFKQNDLIDRQNTLIASQTGLLTSQADSNRMEALSVILSGVSEDDPQSLEIALAMFAAYHEQARPVLLQVALNAENITSVAAIKGLTAGKESHTIAQATELFSVVRGHLLQIPFDYDIAHVANTEGIRLTKGLSVPSTSRARYERYDAILEALAPYMEMWIGGYEYNQEQRGAIFEIGVGRDASESFVRELALLIARFGELKEDNNPDLEGPMWRYHMQLAGINNTFRAGYCDKWSVLIDEILDPGC